MGAAVAEFVPARPEAARFHELSLKEHLLLLVLQALVQVSYAPTCQNLADELFLSPLTVRDRLSSIYAKLGVHDRFQLYLEARRCSLIRKLDAPLDLDDPLDPAREVLGPDVW